MPFAHTPYDGSKQPFSVGLEPLCDADWLEPDDHFKAHLERKVELLSKVPRSVFRAEPETLAAQGEVLSLVRNHLAEHHPAKLDLAGTIAAPLLEAGFDGSHDVPDLVRAALLAQEDLVIMRAGPDGYRIAAAALCFPSSWSLAEKFGQSMFDIHANVPGFNDGRMGAVVSRIFQNLKPGQLVGRFNWSIYDDADLHHPQPKQIAPQIDEDQADMLARLFVRVERQTLRRLDGSGDILFTIKIHHDPMAALARDERRALLATGLRQQLLALEPEQLSYKGLTAHRDALAAALDSLAA